MFGKFPLFQSHLELAHIYWRELVSPGDTVVDATCGNGQDALKLAQLTPENLWLLDLQPEALEKSRQLLEQQLSSEAMTRIHFELGSHTQFPKELSHDSVKLIVYNLGYLPGGDKSLTTMTDSTLESVQQAEKLIVPGGAICITCYPGHVAGAREENALLDLTAQWDPTKWSVCHHRWCNRQKAPSLLLLQKSV